MGGSGRGMDRVVAFTRHVGCKAIVLAIGTTKFIQICDFFVFVLKLLYKEQLFLQ